MNNFYKGWDVHSYENDFNEVLDGNYHYHAIKPITRERFIEVKTEIENFFSPIHPEAKKALDLTLQRYTPPGGTHDPVLKGRINMHRLLVRTWRLVQKINESEIYDLFHHVLQEISTTCYQGLSLRTLQLFVSLWNERFE